MPTEPADSAPQDLRRAARTLAEVAHVLAASDGSHDRVVAALKLLGQVVAYECCALLEVVPNNGRCELFAVPHLPEDERASLRNRLIALLRLMGDETGDAEAIESLPSAPEAAHGDGASATEPTKTHLAIPVIGLNHIIGVLFVEQAFEEYDEHSLRLLTVVAAQLGSYLTTLRLREEEIEHARQLGVALHRLEETDRRKDEFLAMLGHELRNPLGAINNALRILDHGQAESLTRYHQVIDRQIAHLSRIVDDLLDASRVRLGKIVLEFEAVDLKSVVDRWLDAFGTSGPVRSRTVQLSAPKPVVVEGDAIRLEQIVSNLLTNALKYTPSGGRIDVSVEEEPPNGVLRVRDTGIGMTPELLGTIFDLFTQADESLARSQGGLGLGLPLVRSLVENHSGTVEAFSEGLGRGSEFVVRIPLASQGTPSRSSKHTEHKQSLPLRILVVEDNDDVRETLSQMLMLWGHATDEARDGLEGLSRALTRSHDVLLIDIGLPKLDGYAVARRIHDSLGDDAPVMFAMTGYGQPEDRRRAIDAGYDAHLVKPVDAFELQQRLANVRPQKHR